MKSPIEFNSAADLINTIYAKIDKNQVENTNNILNAWDKVVSSIKPDGLKLAAHSRIIDLKNNILLVETDHPGWTQLLQMRRKFILKGLKIEFPRLHINTIAFKLKSDNFKQLGTQLTPTYDDIDKIIDKRLENEEKEEVHTQKKETKSTINPELKKRLDSLRDIILTNS
ncbi:MAG TPA: DUF721 domain-containing protein [Treponemataceae bacterium]|nr:DUF721 domain-containing protein [Treponemataceae bacterium]